MENKTPFGFYYLDREYIEAMHTSENTHVPNADYEDSGRARKFYCGPVMYQNGVGFYVPVSHEIKESMEIPGTRSSGCTEYYGMSLRSKTGEKTGSLNFKYMIPCVNSRFLEKIDPDKTLGSFGKAQYDFCSANERRICNMVYDTYNNIVSGEYPGLTSGSVDFEAAQDEAWQHLDRVEEREEQAAKEKAVQERIAQTEKMNARFEKTKQTLSVETPQTLTNDFDRSQ